MTGLTISTFGGNPVSAVAALATIETIEKENVVEKSETLGKKLGDGFKNFQETHKCVGDARGMGLMQAIELVKRAIKEPIKFSCDNLRIEEFKPDITCHPA